MLLACKSRISKNSHFNSIIYNDKGKGKVFPFQARCGPGMGRGIALLFHNRGTRRGLVVSSTQRPHFTPGKDPVPIVQEAVWAPGPTWTGGKSRSHRDSISDRPARSQSLYRPRYPAHIYNGIYTHAHTHTHTHTHTCVCVLEESNAEVQK